MRTPHRHRPRTRGQIVVIFALAIIAFVGLSAIVIDVSWFWSNSLRMQRAADAAALAGVVHLPGREDLAIDDARAEAKKNGYDNGVGGVSVTPVQDPTNNRRLKVTVSGDVGTFFARVIGINSFHTSRSSKAEYVLPVPMGSPENYYGIYGLVRHCDTTTASGTVCERADGYTTFPPSDPVSEYDHQLVHRRHRPDWHVGERRPTRPRQTTRMRHRRPRTSTRHSADSTSR